MRSATACSAARRRRGPSRIFAGVCTPGLARDSSISLRPALQPGADQFFGHLDVALHAEVLAERECLVGAMRVLRARACRRAECGRSRRASGTIRTPAAAPSHSRATPLSATLHLAPADLLHRAGAHRAAERLRHQLPAQAVAEHRHVLAHRVAHQLERRHDPRQVVVDAHRPAHEGEPGEAPHVLRHRAALVERDQLPGNRPCARGRWQNSAGPSLRACLKMATGFMARNSIALLLLCLAALAAAWRPTSRWSALSATRRRSCRSTAARRGR